MNGSRRERVVALLNLFLYVVLWGWLVSCDTYHFSSPQPIDVKDLVQFPKEARGVWVDEQDLDTVVIAKNTIEFYSYERQVVIKPFGAWERVMDRPAGYYSFQSVRYDTGLNVLDTVANYVIKDGLIYEIKYGLKAGCPFFEKNDSLFCTCKNVFLLELGKKFFLRKISKGQYIINAHESLVIRPDSEWWQILFMEIDNDNRIRTYLPNATIRSDPSLIHRMKDEYFFSAQWSLADVRKNIRKGLFSKEYKMLKRVK